LFIVSRKAEPNTYRGTESEIQSHTNRGLWIRVIDQQPFAQNFFPIFRPTGCYFCVRDPWPALLV
jgi:hypothetical protein